MDQPKKRIELDDLVESYPRTDTPGLQTIYTNKLENNELAGFLDEPPLKDQDEKFWRSQRLFARMYLPPERQECIIMDEPGTGKTCKMINLAMTVKRDNPHLKKIYVLSGNQQINDFRRQLVFSCTSGEYVTPAILEAVNESNKQKSISHAVRKDWVFLTYGKFDKLIRRLYPEDEEDSNTRLTEDYSDCIFILDEFHFVRIDDGRLSFPSGWTPDWVPPPVVGDERPQKVKDRFKQWATIFRVMHLVNRTKKFISTATPITNSISELPYLLNIILPLGQLVPAKLMNNLLLLAGFTPDDDTYYESFNAGEERDAEEWVQYLQPILQGRVVFTAASKRGGRLKYIPISQPTIEGTPLERYFDFHRENSDIIRADRGKYTIDERLRYVEMTGIQRRAYLGIGDVSEDEHSLFDYEIENPSSFYGKPRSITTCVLPDGTYQEKDMSNWITVDNNGDFYINTTMLAVNYDSNDPNPRDLAYWMRYWLNHLSAKMWYIVTGAMYLPGKRYVASVNVYSGGAIFLGLALENAIPRDRNYDPIPNAHSEMYFQRYRPSTRADEDVNYPFVPTTVVKDGKHVKEIDPAKMKIDRRFPKTKRYAIVHGDVKDVEISRIFDLYNHPENIDGEYLKVIIMSRVGQTGVNLMETLYIDILDDPWNPGMLYQAIMRGRLQALTICILNVIEDRLQLN